MDGALAEFDFHSVANESEGSGLISLTFNEVNICYKLHLFDSTEKLYPCHCIFVIVSSC